MTAGANMIRAHPLLGVGVGLFKPLAQVYNPEMRSKFIAHNTYLNVAAELGIPACLAFMATLFLGWRRARRMGKYCLEEGFQAGAALARSIEIGIVGFGVTALFLTADYIKHIWILIFFGVALNRLVKLGIREVGATGPAATPPVMGGGPYGYVPARPQRRY